MKKVFKSVFSNARYILLSGIIAFVIFTIAIISSNIRLIYNLFNMESVSLLNKIEFFASFYKSIGTNFTFFAATYTIIISILFGINISLLVYLIKKRQVTDMSGGVRANIIGVIIGSLGIGCSACGSIILTSILPFLGLSTFVTLLPLGGGEFGILAVLVLIYSTYTLLHQLQQSLTCQSKPDLVLESIDT